MIVKIYVRYCLISLKFFFIVFSIGWGYANPLFQDPSKTTERTTNATPSEEERQENKVPDTGASPPLNDKVSEEKPALKFLQRVYFNGALQLTNGT